MKKIRFLIFIILCLVFIPKVYAQGLTTRITGKSSIMVGETTTLYVKLDADSSIRGVDVAYSSSGVISVLNVSAAGGLSEQSRNGNRLLLYAKSGVPSGSSVLAIKIKGNSLGTGTISITKLEATVNGETVTSLGATFKINVLEDKTQEEEKELNNIEEKETKDNLLLEKATILVEAAEKSIKEDDYEAALKSVNALEDSIEKEGLKERLVEVRVKIATDKALKSCSNTPCNDTKDKYSKKWIIFNIFLLVIIIGEFIYIILMKKEK